MHPLTTSLFKPILTIIIIFLIIIFNYKNNIATHYQEENHFQRKADFEFGQNLTGSLTFLHLVPNLHLKKYI